MRFEAPVWSRPHGFRGTFKLSSLDVATGKTLASSQPVLLPDWASPAFGYSLLGGYEFSIAPAGSGSYVWRARTFYAGGARPTPQMLERSSRSTSGHLTFDAGCGATVSTQIGDAPKDISKRFLAGVPDTTAANSFVLFTPTKVGGVSLYVSETINGRDPNRAMRLVAVDANKKLLWSVPLGKRFVAPPRK